MSHVMQTDSNDSVLRFWTVGQNVDIVIAFHHIKQLVVQGGWSITHTHARPASLSITAARVLRQLSSPSPATGRLNGSVSLDSNQDFLQQPFQETSDAIAHPYRDCLVVSIDLGK